MLCARKHWFLKTVRVCCCLWFQPWGTLNPSNGCVHMFYHPMCRIRDHHVFPSGISCVYEYICCRYFIWISSFSPPSVPLCACSMLCLQTLADPLPPLSIGNVYDLSSLNLVPRDILWLCFLKVCGFWQTSNSRQEIKICSVQWTILDLGI